jgi:hypothetical protein
LYTVIFFPHTCDVEILANFSPKIAKLVEITLLKKGFFQSFPDFFVEEKRKFSPQKKKKNHCLYQHD